MDSAHGERSATMISNEERREVAARLREYASWDEDGGLVECAEFGESVLDLLDGETERECFNALADLIEPGEPKVKCVAEVKIDGGQLEKLAHDAAVELTGIDRAESARLWGWSDERIRRNQSWGAPRAYRA